MEMGILEMGAETAGATEVCTGNIEMADSLDTPVINSVLYLRTLLRKQWEATRGNFAGAPQCVDCTDDAGLPVPICVFVDYPF